MEEGDNDVSAGVASHRGQRVPASLSVHPLPGHPVPPHRARTPGSAPRLPLRGALPVALGVGSSDRGHLARGGGDGGEIYRHLLAAPLKTAVYMFPGPYCGRSDDCLWNIVQYSSILGASSSASL